MNETYLLNGSDENTIIEENNMMNEDVLPRESGSMASIPKEISYKRGDGLTYFLNP